MQQNKTPIPWMGVFICAPNDEEIMKTLGQVGLILAIAVLGDVLSGLLPVVFPGSVIGLLLMFALLCVGLVKLPQVEVAADYFVGNMAVLFVPITVGVVEMYPLLGEHALGVLVLCIVTTFLTFFAVVGTVVFVGRILSGNEKKGEEKC